MSDKVEYIYECGCRRKDFAVKHPSPAKLCPEHGDKLANKVRWCLVCGGEFIVSKKCSSKKYICDEHRYQYNLEARRKINKAWNKKRNRHSEKKNVEEVPVDPEWESTKHLRILEARFPAPVIPEWSPAMARIMNARQTSPDRAGSTL